jgi:hypothetical protein
MTRRRLSLLVSLALAVLLTVPLCAQEPARGRAQTGASASATTHLFFSGTIDGRLAIRMRLEIVGSRVTGSYYYEKYKVPIALGGSLDEHRQLRLEEQSADGKVTGTFSGHFVSDNRVEGTWVTGNGTKAFSFVLDRAGDNDSPPPLKPSASVTPGGWSGTWTLDDKRGFNGGDVTIKEVTSQSFGFDISASSGGHAGEIEGRASINGEKARFAEKTGSGGGATQECIVDFVLRSKAIEISTNDGCQGYGGEGVVFDGSYLHEKPKAAELTLRGLHFSPAKDDVWTDENDRIFAQLTGKDYKKFAETCQLIFAIDDLDEFGAKVHACGVRGLFTFMESIIMTTASGKIYAAVIDDPKVLYFTNDPRYAGTLPKTIDNWRGHFTEKPIVYMSRKAQ